MKKQLTLALGLAVIATPALASKARLEALGEDNFGSYYINDNRNQFLNPARINEAKDLVTYEFGSSSTGTAVTADAAGTPKAEGGFNKAWNNMVWGLHFGNSTPSATVVRSLVGAGNLQERNAWDLFVGGDAGIKWGANLTYEGYKNSSAGNTNSLTSNSLRARVGIISGDLEAFGHVSLKGEANDYQGNNVDGKAGYFLGAGYMMNSYKLFVDYLHVGTDYEVAGAGENEWKLDRIRLGAARQERLNDKTNLFAKLMVSYAKTDNDGATGNPAAGSSAGVSGKTTNLILPLVVGLEYDAASWLALRASVIQNVYGNSKVDPKGAGSKTSGTLANTAVAAGASLKFGELTVDGLISTDNDGNNSAGTTQTTTGGNGSLRTDSLMTRVSMTYRF